jgi:hypothetical protein
MVRRLTALVVVVTVMYAAPARAEEQPRLKIVIPAHLVAPADSQTRPQGTAFPKQSKGNLLAVVAIVAAVVVLGVVVSAKYGD